MLIIKVLECTKKYYWLSHHPFAAINFSLLHIYVIIINNIEIHMY